MERTTRIIILGATGSIGETAFSALSSYRDEFEVVGISCNTSVERALELSRQFSISRLCITGKNIPAPQFDGELFLGTAGLEHMIQETDCDIVLNGISGSQGMVPSFITLNSGRHLALANKESVVMGGHLLFETARKKGVRIIPVDSEHSTIGALIEAHGREKVSSLVITASGGPFRNHSIEEMRTIQVDQALDHPTWSMGPKITIDSATLANKGLEVIEASYLFGMSPEQIEVVIHPQSVVHSMVRLTNGAVYSQMSPPDMALPIMEAVNIHQHRLSGIVRPLDFTALDLSFSCYDQERFPLLALAYKALESGGGYPIVFNRSNEIAVELFLSGQIDFLSIAACVQTALQDDQTRSPSSFEDIISIDSNTQERCAFLFKRFLR